MDARSWTAARVAGVAAGLLPGLYLTTATGFAWLGSPTAPYFLIPLALLGAFSVWRANRWVFLATGILLSAFALVSAPSDPGFLRPDRTVEFAFTLLVDVLAAAALVGGIASVVASGRRAPSGGAMRWGAVGLALVLGLYTGGVLTAVQERVFVPSPATTFVGFKPDVEVNVTALDNAWRPDTLSVKAGALVLLHVKNVGRADHIFNQEQLKLAVELPTGSSRDIWIRMPTAGTFQYYCEWHASNVNGKWNGMVATLHVS